MEKNKNRIATIWLYTLSMVVAYIPRYGRITVGKTLQLSIGLFWLLLAFLRMVVNRFRFNTEYKRDIPWMVGSYLVPSMVLHLWTIVLMIFGVLPWENLTTNISTYIPILLAISSVYMFGKNALRLNFYALAFAYFISVALSAVFIGLSVIPDGVVKAFGGKGVLKANYLELHDIVLSIGFVLIYYIFSKEKLTKRNVGTILLTVLIMLLGLKRISVLGVFLAVLFHKIVKRYSPKLQYKICRIAGVIAIICCFLFVWFLINAEDFLAFFEQLGVNLKGRNYYWVALATRCEFSPTFLGLGRNYSYLLFSSELEYMNVGAAHSDILKMYAENGFFFFAYWLWHYLLNMTKRYKNRFSADVALVYFGAAVYLFTMYITDNVETYFASTIFSILVPVCYAMQHDRGNRREGGHWLPAMSIDKITVRKS